MSERIDNLIWVPTPEFMDNERIFVEKSLEEIGAPAVGKIVETAIEFRKHAYTPYSHYDVGAALLTDKGEIYGGCNSENVGYSPTNHAEGTAVAMANASGKGRENRKFIKAIAVVADGDSGPCGECLQRIAEHADNCLIVVSDTEGKIRRITSLLAIFPYNFNPSHLGLK